MLRFLWQGANSHSQYNEVLPTYEDYVQEQVIKWYEEKFKYWTKLKEELLNNSKQGNLDSSDLNKFLVEFRKQLFSNLTYITSKYPQKIDDYQEFKNYFISKVKFQAENEKSHKIQIKKMYIIKNLCKILNLSSNTKFIKKISNLESSKFTSFFDLIQVIFSQYKSLENVNQFSEEDNSEDEKEEDEDEKDKDAEKKLKNYDTYKKDFLIQSLYKSLQQKSQIENQGIVNSFRDDLNLIKEDPKYNEENNCNSKLLNSKKKTKCSSCGKIDLNKPNISKKSTVQNKKEDLTIGYNFKQYCPNLSVSNERNIIDSINSNQTYFKDCKLNICQENQIYEFSDIRKNDRIHSLEFIV